jgi:hypothetical protein
VWVLNVGFNDDKAAMYFYLYSKYNKPYSYTNDNPPVIPVGKWIHVEALYKQSSEKTGSIKIWQDGSKIFDVSDVRTILDGNATWGIGNYTNHIIGELIPGSATVFLDDAAVSELPLRGQ